MRFFSFIPILVALVTVVAGAPAPADPCADTEIGCGTHVAPKRDFIVHPLRDVGGLTNAELLRRALPLKNPVLRRGTPVRRNHPSPSSSPPVKITHRGFIEVHDAGNNNLLGYVSKNLGNGGAQFVYDPSITNALNVTFDTDGTGSGTRLDINAIDSNPTWPLLGLVQGRDDVDSNLKSGSYQYLYLGGVANPGTQPGDTPQSISNSYFIGAPRTAETAVWTYNSVTGTLAPQWINTDGSSPAEQFFTQSNGLYVGGDQSAFAARYLAPVTSITFKFVSQ